MPGQASEAATSAASSSSQERSELIQTTPDLGGEQPLIKNVLADNLEVELNEIMSFVNDYPYIAMDTEFPGIVARPIGTFKDSDDYHYQSLKCNVDMLKIIQLGLTFFDKDGNRRPGTCTWQFNFSFNLNDDMYAQDSIELLLGAGLDFKTHQEKGIDVGVFGELIMTSGIVLNDNVRWISFHGSYDFAYLLKLLCCKPLPPDEADFFKILAIFFSSSFDIKYMLKEAKDMHGGLQHLADDLKIQRHGDNHQAGSDSLLTGEVFFEIKKKYFDGKISDEKYSGVIFGLGRAHKNTTKTRSQLLREQMQAGRDHYFG